MRPPRLILLLACLIFLPILLTTLSLLSAHPRHASNSQSSVSGVGRLKALVSFHAPASLFPPTAMISLTDDNSTFFLARPAAFGPALPNSGLSGQLWIGSGFGDDALRKGGITTGAEGELGCSDVPGWEESDKKPHKMSGSDGEPKRLTSGIKSETSTNDAGKVIDKRVDEHPFNHAGLGGKGDGPSKDDGTDDHLHHPLPESGSPSPPDADKTKKLEHADIQSLQESAEIRGKIVLLSRGGCGFLEKVKWVQRRGGIALVVGDHTRGGGLVTMYARGDTSNVTIPAIFTSHTTAHLLSSLIPPEIPGEPNSSEDPSKVTPGDKLDKNSKIDKSPSATITASKPTSTTDSKSSPKKGFLNSLFSFIGLGHDHAYPWHLQEDSRRPPSSGNIDWVMLDEFDKETLPNSKKAAQNRQGKAAGAGKSSESAQGSNDDFVIGVQDWRDPDLVLAGKNSNLHKSTSKPNTTGSKKKDADAVRGDSKPGHGGNGLKGGSITPGSGEYAPNDKSTNVKGTGGGSNSPSVATNSRPGNSNEGSHWWSNMFGWSGRSHGDGSSTSPEDKSKGQSAKNAKATTVPMHKFSKESGKHQDHEGLWVTLTPTSMSTSPFFDTLLVLVVSPLITLTVVYALLLLRSRIRRRRWRAPKAVVDRLPVRTYHTITSMPSSSCSPHAASSSEASSPSSPLLSHSRPRSPRPRQRSQTTSGIVAASSHDATNDSPSTSAEKSNSGSSLWRRRYTSRQVECAVCLEEYIDGQSRVMSLPCGHEFHAECITPWLTTRRRTCPICKGDVVRSLGRRSSSPQRSGHPERMSEDMQARIAETRNDSPSAAVPLDYVPDDIDSDLEQGDNSTTSLLNNSQNSSSQSNWSNLASLRLFALRGDSMWHQTPSRSDRNR
ncbi:hypothetical protein PABG_07193 [Paracoccidioides brasiliensis Pb03]|nr:hypothetical protein PABG_07193 [Paracoccidioides brasiliensis Pb03]